jgi:hypothetical protein
MTVFTAGSGLGAWATVARHKEYVEGFNTSSPRTLYFKTFKPTWDPHFVQGGPYLAGGRIADIGSAHVKMYRDAKATLTGDVMTTAQALLLVSAFGSNGTLKQSGTGAAYELYTGTAKKGIVLEAPESHDVAKESTFLDIEVGVPYTNAENVGWRYRGGVVTKAEFVFDRMALVSYSYDIDFRYVEPNLNPTLPTFTTNGVPFAMNEGGSAFKIGFPGSTSALAGVRKMTVTLEHKMATDRIYLGGEEKEIPVSNGLVDVGISLEADYTANAKTVFETFLKNEAQEIFAEAEGAEIGTSGKKNKLVFKMPNIFIGSGAEPPIDGPDLIKNTLSAKGTINAANEAVVSAELTTADASY